MSKENTKSAEELAQIAFLDELRASDYGPQPERPVAVVVKVISVCDVPKAGNQYALAEVTDGTAAWKVCLPRGVVKARQRALFVSEDAILPMDERYRCGKPPIANQRNLKGGIPMLTPIVRRNVYRANQGVLYPVAAFSELKKCAVGDVVAGILHILSEKQQKAKKDRHIADELARAKANKAVKKVRAQEQLRDDQALEWRENCETIGPALDFVQKTALDPIEESPELFEQYTDCLFEVTEKMCGLNLSVYCDRSGNPDNPIGVCVNGQEIMDDPKEFHWSLVRRLGVDAALLKCSHDLVVEGVVIGPGIRGGRFVGYRSNEFRIFDIYDITEERQLQPVERKVFCLESSSLPLGVYDYVLERFIPADFKSQMPTIEEVEGELTRRMEIAEVRKSVKCPGQDDVGL